MKPELSSLMLIHTKSWGDQSTVAQGYVEVQSDYPLFKLFTSL